MLLEAVEGGPGLLVATYEKQFRFLHLSFQEYLTACELLYRPAAGGAGCRCCRPAVSPRAWSST